MNERRTEIESIENEIAALRKQVEDYKALSVELTERVPAGVMVLDRTGIVLTLNRNMTAMFDIKSCNPSGRHYADSVPEDIAEQIRQVRSEVMEKGFVINRPLHHSIDKAIEIDIGLNATLFEMNGQPLIIIVCHDRTAVNELERLRTLDAKKTESISRVAHELKSPLTAIKAYCDVLIETYRSDSTAAGFIQGIDSETERLLRLVGELMNVTSIELGQVRPVLHQVDMAHLARETLQEMNMTNKKHRLVLRSEQGLPSVMADGAMLKEVITNLVSNAINHSPTGGDVVVELRKQGKNVKMDVIDQGLGIPREHLANIFQKFYRVYRPDYPDIPGSGLGLAIVKGIVEAHKGTITVKSAPSEGSKFSVLLPVSRAFDAAREEAALGRQPFA
jgi:signal transduction histidine kinase